MIDKPQRRLTSIDLMRGFAVVAMIPTHVFFLSSFFNPTSTSIWVSLPFPMEFRPPLCTGLVLFFFVTGLSLAASLSRGTKDRLSIILKMIKRYGLYFLSALLLDILLFSFLALRNSTPIDLVSWLYMIPGSFATFGAPVMDLSIAAIIALPIILSFDWKRMMFSALGIAITVTIMLYVIQSLFPYDPSLVYLSGLPPISILNPLLIGMYSALKGLPIILIGACLGKLILEGKKIQNKIFLISIAIITFYMGLMLVVGSSLIPLLMPVWIYPHAVLFIIASSMFMFTLFQTIEAKQIHLGLLQALGRISIISYTGQFVILLPVLSILNYPVDNIGLLFILSIVSELIIMVLAYFYCTRKWGPISSW